MTKYTIPRFCCTVRDAGSCRYVERETDLDHIRTRGAGGGDDHWNLMPLCRFHHSERHQIGVNAMAKKYPRYRRWLQRNGWKIDFADGKWRQEVY